MKIQITVAILIVLAGVHVFGGENQISSAPVPVVIEVGSGRAVKTPQTVRDAAREWRAAHGGQLPPGGLERAQVPADVEISGFRGGGEESYVQRMNYPRRVTVTFEARVSDQKVVRQ